MNLLYLRYLLHLVLQWLLEDLVGQLHLEHLGLLKNLLYLRYRLHLEHQLRLEHLDHLVLLVDQLHLVLLEHPNYLQYLMNHLNQQNHLNLNYLKNPVNLCLQHFLHQNHQHVLVQFPMRLRLHLLLTKQQEMVMNSICQNYFRLILLLLVQVQPENLLILHFQQQPIMLNLVLQLKTDLCGNLQHHHLHHLHLHHHHHQQRLDIEVLLHLLVQ